MKKTFALVLLTGSLALASLPILTGIAIAETLTLKVVTAWPKRSTDNKSLFYFMESVEQQVAKKYPGELKLNLVEEGLTPSNPGPGPCCADRHG